MRLREFDRLKVIHQVLTGKLKRRDAAAQLHLSRRQVIRLLKRVRKDGSKGIIHRLRGRSSNHQLKSGLLERALGIVSKKYPDFGPTFANEKLREDHGIQLATNTLREGMIQQGLWQPRKQKRKYRCCRQRRSCPGELIQLDGSVHDWFEGRALRCVLLLYIDDASSKIFYAEFVTSEDTLNLMLSTKRYLQKYGRPVSFYVDKDSIYRINRQASIEEQLRDSQPLTQFARAMKELNIKVIFANSPQAKGRVERSFQTHQDRLTKELRIRKISSIEVANEFLWNYYIGRHNARFSVPPASKTDAHQPLLKSQSLEEILSLRTERTLMNDFTLRFNNYFFQILPDQTVKVGPKDKILVEVRLDQSIHLRFKDCYLNFRAVAKPKPTAANQPQTLIKPHRPPTPGKDHPWRKFRYSKLEPFTERIPPENL